ncbi:hypothetical protein [Bacillus sp. FSL K6-0268]
MLQKTIRPRVTEPMDSLPSITKEKGVAYGKNIPNEGIKIGDRRISVTKYEDELGIGVGQGQKTQQKPHVLDDYTTHRVIQVYTDQLEFLPIYIIQLERWQTEVSLTLNQQNEIKRLLEQVIINCF